MPELPEVETIKTGLVPAMENQKIDNVILNRKDLRFPFPDHFIADLEKKSIRSLERRAKYILAHLESEKTLIIHLGMSGRFQIEWPASKGIEDAGGSLKPLNPIHNHVIFQMNNGARVIYNDPRRFGYMDVISTQEIPNHRYFKNLGVEPLSDAFNARHISDLARLKKTPLKTFLLDQKNIAGLGNIYVCEALFRSGLSPLRAADCLSTTGFKQKREMLVEEIKKILEEAIKAGGSSLRDYRHADGQTGYFQHSFKVYDKAEKPCANEKCTAQILRIKQAGRSTFYCPKCQK